MLLVKSLVLRVAHCIMEVALLFVIQVPETNAIRYLEGVRSLNCIEMKNFLPCTK